VAVIHIDPDGVWVDPVVDVVKISLAAFAVAATVARAVLRVALPPPLARERAPFGRRARRLPGKPAARVLRALLRRPARRRGLFARFARSRRIPPVRLMVTQLRSLIPAPPVPHRQHA
jgi:hypothetical protein